MAATLKDQAKEILSYHDDLKTGGVTEALLHELVAIAARGIANKAE